MTLMQTGVDLLLCSLTKCCRDRIEAIVKGTHPLFASSDSLQISFSVSRPSKFTPADWLQPRLPNLGQSFSSLYQILDPKCRSPSRIGCVNSRCSGLK